MSPLRSGQLFAFGQRRLRIGVSLVELLTIVAIIGMLFLLLLPAIQAAREDARRKACANNLKLVGIGWHKYHDVHQVFPPSYVNIGNEVRWGWGTLILPFVEHTALYEKLEPTRRRGLVPSRSNGMQERVNVYRCPSDPLRYGLNPHFDRSGREQGASNYVANESVAAYLRNRHDAHTMAEIIDGTANTMLVGERDTFRNAGAVWPGRARSTSSTGFRVTWPINLKGYDGSDYWNSCRRYALASEHEGGVNVVFCDGTLRFLNEDIEAAVGGNCGNAIHDPVHKFYPKNDCVYQKLFNRKDGLSIGSF